MSTVTSAVKQEDQLDKELLAKVGEECRISFSELFKKYHTPLTRFAYRHVNSQEIIEEVVNDTMLVVWQKAKQFRGDSKVSTWIMGIALRKCWEARNKINHKEIYTDEVPEHVDPEDSYGALDKRQTIDLAMQNLSEDHRATVELAYYGGYTCEEIAGVMSCPVNTIKTRLHYARKQLKKILKRQDADFHFENTTGQ